MQEDFYQIVLSKIQEKGVKVIKNKRGENSPLVWQHANINDTQLVVSYEYELFADGGYAVRKMSVGYQDSMRKCYKPVIKFADYNQQRILMSSIFNSLENPGNQVKKLELIKQLANNEFVQKTK